MDSIPKPRFNSPEAALRFFFRARELLDGSVRRAFQIRDELPPGASRGSGVFGDFAAVESCFDKLDDFQIWLMAELYGPTCFAARQRTVGRAWRAAQSQFPGRHITLRDMSRIRRGTLDLLRQRLAIKGLIPAATGTNAGPAIRVAGVARARGGGSQLRH
jgi:hypothetical protein